MAHIINGDENDNQLYGSWEDDILNGLAGNDVLQGADGNDILAGGTGNDMLDGGRGNDTYLFNLGDGHDTIMSLDTTLGKHDMVRFGEGIDADTLKAERIGNSLRLWIPGTEDSLQIENFFDGGGWNGDSVRPFGVEELRFFDGRSWDLTTIMERVAPTFVLGEGDDFFYGGGNIDGGAGNDNLHGDYGDNLLRGGSGNDALFGGYGNDVLIGGSGDDVLDGGAGVNTFQFSAGWGNDTIVLNGMDGAPQVTQIELDSVQAGMMSMERSDGGTGMDLILRRKGATDSITIKDYFSSNTAAAQSVRIVFEGHEIWTYDRIAMAMSMPPGQVLKGTDGNDVLPGTWGDDTLAGAGGDDLLYGGNGNDTLDGGDGMDQLIGNEGNDLILGGAGDDQLRGEAGNDTLDGGAGNDMLDGGAGNNLILFGRDSGHDTLIAYPDATNTVVLAADVRPDDVIVMAQSGYQLVVSIRGSDATLSMPLILQYPNDGGAPVQHTFATLRFADGTVWDEALVLRHAYTGDDAPNQIYGSQADDWMDGRGGNDILEGRMGNDHIDGGAGDDLLRGEEGDDVLRGGQGNDVLDGGTGNNTFRFANGDGHDFIVPSGDRGTPSLSTIVFDAGIAPSDVTVAYSKDPNRSDLILTYNHGADQIAIPQFHTYGQPDLTVIVRFADGSSWNNAELDRRSLLGDDGFNDIQGTEGNDVLDGQGGDDTLKGNGGNDTLLGGDGNDFLDGGMGNDTIVGGKGADFISAHDAGSDVYVFNQGDGADVISYSPWQASGGDAIRFGQGITKSDIHMWTSGTTLTINYGSGEIRVENYQQQNETHAPLINNFMFDDGSSYTYSDLNNHAPVVAMPLPDVQVNEGASLKFIVPAGTFFDPDQNDGGTMSATKLPSWLSFDPKSLTFSGTPTYGDVGQFDVTVTWTDLGGLSASDTFHLTVAGAPSLTLYGSAYADVLVGKSGNDSLYGYAGNDTLDGGAGADRMVGGLGDDTYYVDNAGDTVIEMGSEGNDLVYASVSHVLAPNLERLTLTGTAAINATGNNLSNLLIGNSGANILDGGLGADTMTGGAGNDTYIVDNGSDVVNEAAGEGIDRVLSSVGRTLGANQEILILTGSSAISGSGNALNNLIQGNSASNSLSGGDGYDILQGGGGNDVLSDYSVLGNVLDGGAGDDRLSGSSAADLFIGGDGWDNLSVGNGADVIAFNRGDGVDTVAATNGNDNTVSLGHGIRYADLALTKSGSDLILNVGAGEQIAFKSWYSGYQSVGNLQMVIEGGADYLPTSGAGIHDNKVEQFNFAGLVARFDALRAADPALSSWSMDGAMAEFSTGGSDGAAIGGDLAYRYAIDDSLNALTSTPALAILSGPQFGTTKQTLQPASFLRDGTTMLY